MSATDLPPPALMTPPVDPGEMPQRPSAWPMVIGVIAIIFGSLAILIAGLGGVAPDRRGDLARLALRSLVAGTLATMLTGSVVGMYV